MEPRPPPTSTSGEGSFRRFRSSASSQGSPVPTTPKPQALGLPASPRTKGPQSPGRTVSFASQGSRQLVVYEGTQGRTISSDGAVSPASSSQGLLVDGRQQLIASEIPPPKTPSVPNWRLQVAPIKEQKAEVKIRTKVVARSVEEGIIALRDSNCMELDFTHHAVLSSKEVDGLQQMMEDIEAEFGALPKVGSTHLLRREDLRQQHAQLLENLLELQAKAISLFEELASNKTVQRLRVDFKHLGDDSGGALAKALAGNQSILELNVATNYLTSLSAGLIGVELRHHPIQELYFDFNQIGGRGADQLAAALHGHKELKILSLKGNRIGPDFPRALLWLLTPRPESSGGRIRDDQESTTGCLHSLRLEFNNIEALPLRLGTVDTCDIRVTQNPITHPPPGVISQGWHATYNVLRKDFLLSEQILANELRERNLALERNMMSLPWVPAQDLEGVTADDF